jgi:uncharacterized protein (TIGR03437 family)
VITLYVTGFGQTQDQPKNVYGNSRSHPVVYFGTLAAETLATIPAEGQPGLWLLKVRVPERNLQSGVSPITVLKDGVHSNTGSVWAE